MINIVVSGSQLQFKQPNFILGYAFVINQIKERDYCDQELIDIISLTILQQRLLCYEHESEELQKIFQIHAKESTLVYQQTNRDILISIVNDLKMQNQQMLQWLNKQDKPIKVSILTILKNNLYNLNNNDKHKLTAIAEKALKDKFLSKNQN